MEPLPEALADLTPDQMLAIMERMRTIARLRRGAEVRAEAQARVVRRSAASFACEFFERKHAESPISTPASAGGPDPAQIAAELERIRAGNVTALLAKGAPSTGCWTRAKFPRTGWSLLTVEDTGQTDGACCEVCERTMMRFSYVLHHATWPPAPPAAEQGSATYACRLCAAHLLGNAVAPADAGAKSKRRNKAAQREPQPHEWLDLSAVGANQHHSRRKLGL